MVSYEVQDWRCPSRFCFLCLGVFISKWGQNGPEGCWIPGWRANWWELDVSSGGESQAYVLSQGSVQSWFYSCPPPWEPFCWMANMWISGPRGVELSWPPWIIWDLGLLRSVSRTHLSGTGQGLKTPSDDNCCFPGFAVSKPCASPPPPPRSADWVTDLCGLLSASVPLVFLSLPLSLSFLISPLFLSFKHWQRSYACVGQAMNRRWAAQ